ncbi:MAG: hypothetical protein ACRC62_23480 [Microcoleus sp.]
MSITRIFSSGGGVQSTAVLVLSAQKAIDYPIHVFANVGRAESPKTIEYIEDVIKPYAAVQGIEWVEVRKTSREGKTIDLLDSLEHSEKSVQIPVRMAGSGAPGNRACTVDWKIKVVAKYLKGMAKDHPDRRIVLGKGISTDEAQRAKPDSGFNYYDVAYPLIELGLSRLDCTEIIRKAGLPPAPKSSCWFCPYKTKRGWQEMRDADPDLFWKAVELEKKLHQRSVKLGRGGCYFTSTGTSKDLFLDEVTSPHYQGTLFHGFDDAECESGYCWT